MYNFIDTECGILIFFRYFLPERQTNRLHISTFAEFWSIVKEIDNTIVIDTSYKELYYSSNGANCFFNIEDDEIIVNQYYHDFNPQVIEEFLSSFIDDHVFSSIGNAYSTYENRKTAEVKSKKKNIPRKISAPASRHIKAAIGA